MKKQFIYSLICIAILLSCSTDDGNGAEKIVLRGIEGKVLGTISCQTENNGLAYEIEIKNLESPTKIITASLPEEFKQEGLTIEFNMEKSLEGFSVCVQLYDSSIFFELSKISLINVNSYEE